MRVLRSLPLALWLILAVALATRLVGAWFGNLMYDERAHLALAQTIDFRPEHLHLVFRTLDHPLLSIYIVKFSSLLFGQSDFGLRVIHVLVGTATVIPVYLLGSRLRSSETGLWAAAFLAVDQFHVSWSRMFMPEVVMLFFWSLALLQVLNVVRTQSTGGFALLGVWIGLAYLAKETGILLLPVVWSFVLVSAEHRRLLLSPGWYLAHSVFLLIIAPDIIWNLIHYSESYLHRDAQLLAEEFRLQGKSVSIYLGELIRELIDVNALDTDYLQGNAFACHWPAGILYLTSIAAGMRPPIPAPRRLLLLGFGIVFLFFTALPGGNRFEPFWWASASLISAVVLTGAMIHQAASHSRMVRWICLLLLLYLAGHVTMLMTRPGGPGGRGYPRATVQELAAESLEDARYAIAERDLRSAHFHVIYALNIGGPDADAYFHLGYLQLLDKEYQAAETSLERALELHPEHAAARGLLKSLRRR